MRKSKKISLGPKENQRKGSSAKAKFCSAWIFSRLGLKIFIFTLIVSLICPLPLLAEINEKDEVELGRKVQIQISAAKAIFEDPVVNKYYNQVAQRVLNAAGRTPYPFHFYILNSNSINAFAVPGGYIYMHTETIISLENEGQLASILAHEIAHITSRHFARRVEASKNISLLSLAAVLAGVLVGAGGGSAGAALGPALMMGGTGASVQAMLAHSRSDETEADTKGRRYLLNAGYQVRDMYGAFKIMSEKTYQLAPNIPTYLSTHPDLTYRLATTFQDSAKEGPPPPDVRYQGIRDRVLALSGETRRVRTLFDGRLKKNPSDAAALHGLGLLAAREQNLTLADKLMNQALSFAPGNREYLADLGDLALKRRKPAEAKTFFEKSGADNPQSMLGLARAYELLQENAKAAVWYDKAVNAQDAPYNEALEMAGRFFGKINQPGKGHYYLAQFFQNTGDLHQAVFHFEACTKSADAGNLRTKAQREMDSLKRFMEETKYPASKNRK